MIIEIGVQEILMNDIQNTKSVALKSLSGALVFMTYQPHPRAGRELVARLIHCYSYHWSIDHTKPKGRMTVKVPRRFWRRLSSREVVKSFDQRQHQTGVSVCTRELDLGALPNTFTEGMAVGRRLLKRISIQT